MALVGFEDGERGSEAKECGLLLAAEKVKRRNSSVEPPEENTALLTP